MSKSEEVKVKNGARPGEVSLSAVGGYTNIGRLLAIEVDDTSAPRRLIAVKKKFNQLADHGTSLEDEHSQSKYMVLFASLFSICACCALPGMEDSQEKAMVKLAGSMNDCVKQINVLRANFQHLDTWENAENSVTLNADTFGNSRSQADRTKLMNNRL